MLVTGIHHVTALAKSPTANIEFYTSVLGLRLVKRTVNFDDPFTYHFYYGDAAGSPGTLITHFPHPLAAKAAHGGGEITDTDFAVPRGTLARWTDRLQAAGTHVARDVQFGQDILTLSDPDGMLIRLTESRDASARQDEGILRIARVRLRVPDVGETAEFLSGVLGFRDASSEGTTRRLTLGDGGDGREIDVVHDPAAPHHPMGAGTVHHVAWRVPDDGAQARAADAIREARIAVTPVMDRQYFKSIYFRIPGGVIFEIATDGPGFAVDEAPDALGTALKLPPRYEPRRAEIERRLPPISKP